MTTKKVEKTVSKGIRFPESTLKALKSEAKRLKMTENNYVVTIVQKALGLKAEQKTTLPLRRVTCPCGHKWNTRSAKPKCYRCKKYLKT